MDVETAGTDLPSHSWAQFQTAAFKAQQVAKHKKHYTYQKKFTTIKNTIYNICILLISAEQKTFKQHFRQGLLCICMKLGPGEDLDKFSGKIIYTDCY